ncbi:MAG: bifunctional phosphopantothenoylcysteine decarboxylase/phosphopantothenate--cysteine ligase CoaBC [Williamsia sp.]|nr:bifunctional phosphopantothenoylcysteine decarboxylase/phosphopantothenate--cysteine ligase CoaBC [Williamsia sp.]
MFKGKKILLGISGSIAAYKSVLLVRQIVKGGGEVKVVMTHAAKSFVSPLTLSTLSKNPVQDELFTENTWANHVMLGRWADVMLIAPLSCNTLAKMAGGLCDNLLLATYLSATCPVIVAPAMDDDMWHHPATKRNLSLLQSYGNKVIPAQYGELASGLVGDGRMAEPGEIARFLHDHVFQSGELAGKKVLVTAGPTYEPLDPVRFIGNHSSGKMGVAIAQELVRRGAVVTLVLGPSSVKFDPSGMVVQRVQSAGEMYDACMDAFNGSDVGVMAAAVADYTPVTVEKQKIKKQAATLTLELTRSKDILKALGARKQGNQVLVGFSLETNNEQENALGKLASKNADMIVLNSLQDEGAGFGHDTNKITIFKRGGEVLTYDRKPKEAVAKDIVDQIVKMLYA